MLSNLTVSDIFGQLFIIGLGPSWELHRLFEPLNINDPMSARQLLTRLNVPTGYWLRVLHQVETSLSHRSLSEADSYQLAANLVMARKINIFKLASAGTVTCGAANHKIDNGRTIVEFSTPTEHLLDRQHQLKRFSSAAEAVWWTHESRQISV